MGHIDRVFHGSHLDELPLHNQGLVSGLDHFFIYIFTQNILKKIRIFKNS
jgi:hypothetical protein